MNVKFQDSELTIRILLEMEALPHEVIAVEGVAKDEGIRSSVRATFFRMSEGQLPWVIFLMAPIVVFSAAFFKAAGQEAGRDAYQALRRFVSKLYAARRDASGSVAFWDPETNTHVALQRDLPAEAYRKLILIDPEQLEGGHWVWDFEQNEWNRK